MGIVHEKEARLEKAKADYLQALSADPRLVHSYRRSTEIAFENKKWDEVVQLTTALISVHSSDVPIAYLYNAAGAGNQVTVRLLRHSKRKRGATALAKLNFTR